jgi:prevent-host-death family protein
MSKPISAANANRRFSSLLREVRQGTSYIVTSHGRPVAKIIPFRPADELNEGAKRVLVDRLSVQPVTDVGRWTREELYEN